MNEWRYPESYPESEMAYIIKTFGSFEEYVRVLDQHEVETEDEHAFYAEGFAESDKLGIIERACAEIDAMMRPASVVWGM